MQARAWMDEATGIFLGALEKVTDDEMDAATGLPGWSRRHLVAHVHFNARALQRLVSWAATGTESRMYASPEQRNAEIAEGAALSPAELRRLVRVSADELAAALDGLAPEAWEAQVVTAQGRTVPATEIPWMRTREVAVHAVDLGVGVTFDDLPSDLVTALAVDVVRKRSTGGEGPALAAWLTGRTAQAPQLGPWL